MTAAMAGEEDLTARARIRGAAFALVAERGVAGVTLREAARRAAVSPGLVVHHFGSRQGLLDAVSEWVVDHLHQATRDSAADADPVALHRSRQARFDRMVAEVPHLGDYVRRMLLDGTPEGLAWFRRAVDQSAGEIAARERLGTARPSADVRAEAALLIVLGFAPVLLRPLLEHALDMDLQDPAARARWRRMQSEILTSALYQPSGEVGPGGEAGRDPFLGRGSGR
jgi:TetR/AcrR family transcriptional regulator, regulator of cefoperazone and chloramphenicol sensitivity